MVAVLLTGCGSAKRVEEGDVSSFSVVVSEVFCGTIAVSTEVSEEVCTIEDSAIFLVIFSSFSIVVSGFFRPVAAVSARVSEEACAIKESTVFLVIVSAFFRLGAFGSGWAASSVFAFVLRRLVCGGFSTPSALASAFRRRAGFGLSTASSKLASVF